MKRQIKEIKEDINKLGNDGFNLEVKLEELEQYARSDCLEITGIPVVPNENPALLVKEMSEIMGVNLNENDISIAHRFTTNDGSERSTNCQVHSKREKRRNLQREEKLKI